MTDIKTTDVTFPANGIEGMGYLARPDDDLPHPGLIVIQEWWGLDGHIKSIADRFAREGFIALAPDMYHGHFATEPDEARKLVMNMNREQALKDLLGSVSYLQSLDAVSPKKLGCIGFCLGGRMTFSLAAATPDIVAGAPFYGGTPTADEVMPIAAELFCAYGADDGGIPVDNVRALETTLKSQGKNAVVKVYEGAPHSFFNDTKESYRPEAAQDAWSNALALFRRVLLDGR